MADKKMKTRLGIDIGSNSIGWALIEIDDHGDFVDIVRTGARVFPDGRKPGKVRKLGASLNETRRTKRGERRRRDRYLRRRDTLIDELIEAKLMPDCRAERRRLQDFDPYELRALAVTDPSKLDALAKQRTADSLHLIGRAIFHLHQRRGFNPNFRIVKKGGKDDEGKVKKSIESVRQEMKAKEAKTFGHWLWMRREKDRCAIVRARPVPSKSKNTQDSETDESSGISGFERYPSREFIENEFNAIWDAQKHRGGIFADGDKKRKKIHHAIFHQRGLRPPIVGWCVYYNGNQTDYNPNSRRFRRAARALPSFQKFRILQIVNNLKFWGDDGEILTLRADDENPRPDWRERVQCARKAIIAKMLVQKIISFAALKRILKAKKYGGIIAGNVKLNFEDERTKDKGLDGSDTGAIFGSKKALKRVWSEWDISKQDDFVSLLIDSKDEKTLRENLAGAEWRLREEEIEACLAAYPELAKGYARMSGRAIRELTAKMEDGTPYHEAAEAIFGAHTREHGSGDKPKLPPYPEALSPQFCQPRRKQDEKDLTTWRISNPTVHIGLNQLRLVVNDIIRKHGKPDRFTVELARDLNNQQQRNDLIARNEQRRKENARLNELILEQGKPLTDENRLLLRLWQEQGHPNNRRCVYCVAQKTGDGYPEKRCAFCRPPPKKGKEIVDDSPLTCVYCNGKNCSGKNIGIAALLSDNREFEKDHILPQSKTFDDSPANLVLACRKCNQEKGNKTPHEWLGKAALACAKRLPKNKRWRFADNAMEEFEKRRGIMGNKIAATRYLGRAVIRYLEEIAPKNKVNAVAGPMTARLRRHWKLNRIVNEKGKNWKDRADHRHHAIDALVVAVAGGGYTRHLHNQLVSAAKKAEKQNTDDFLAHLPEEPRRGFYAEAEQNIRRIIVSHKPDRKKQTGALFQGYTYHASVVDGEKMLARKVPVESLTPEQVFPETAKKKKKTIANPRVRDLLRTMILGVTEETLSQLDGEAIRRAVSSIKDSGVFAERLADAAQNKNIRRVLLMEKGAGIGISNAHGKAYKTLLTDENAALRIYRNHESGEIRTEIVTFLDMARGKKLSDPAALELRKGDMFKLIAPQAIDIVPLGKLASETDRPIIVVVQSISKDMITLREHLFAGHPKLKRQVDMRISRFVSRRPRKLHVSPSGLVCVDEKSPEL